MINILYLKYIISKQNTIHVNRYNTILNHIIKIILACITLIVLVKIFVYDYNPQITKTLNNENYKNIYYYISNTFTYVYCIKLSMLVGISETIRLLIFYNKKNFISTVHPIIDSNKRFNQWLAGLIDGNGCFQLSKKGYASLEITVEMRDKHCLYQIKQKFGGNIKLKSGVNWLRYRLHHKSGLINIINAVNGEIRNPIRLIQLNKICNVYNINLIQPLNLTYYNGWLSGFFDSDGSIYLNLLSDQVFISASQKNRFLLEILLPLYGGKIYIMKESFKWCIYKKEDILKILDYFQYCPSRTKKFNRINSLDRYFELKILKAHISKDPLLKKAWNSFIINWNKWEN